MKKSVIMLIISSLLYRCSKNEDGELGRKIEAEITKTCKNKNCNINLHKITPFKWKKFYVFRETASLETVEKAINQGYPYFTDIGSRLIFIDENNKIVYHEDIFPDVEKPLKNKIVFYIPDTVSFMIYTNPNFTVAKEEMEKGYYYILKQ